MTGTRAAEKAAETARRKQETSDEARRLPRPGSMGDLTAADPHRLPAAWSARHTGRQRVRTPLETTGRPVYHSDAETTGTTWAREREIHREERPAVAAARRDGVHEQRTAVSTQP